MEVSNGVSDGHRHKVPGQYIHEGMVMSGDFTPRYHLEKVKDMEIFEDDVIISTYPKCGCTFMKEITWLIIHNAEIETSKKVGNFKRVPHFDNYSTDPYEYDGLTHAIQTPRPRLLTTHLPERLLPDQARQKKVKQITVFRNPKDVMASFYNFYKISAWCGFFRGNWDEFFEMAMADKLVRGSIFDHVAGWWARRHDPNVLILFFEDVIRSPKEEVRKIANFLGKALSEENICKIVEATEFKNMKSNPMTNGSTLSYLDTSKTPFIRKGTIGDWKNYFTIYQNQRFDELINERIGGLGINYTYE